MLFTYLGQAILLQSLLSSIVCLYALFLDITVTTALLDPLAQAICPWDEETSSCTVRSNRLMIVGAKNQARWLIWSLPGTSWRGRSFGEIDKFQVHPLEIGVANGTLQAESPFGQWKLVMAKSGRMRVFWVTRLLHQSRNPDGAPNKEGPPEALQQ